MVSQLEYKKRIASTKNLQKIFSAQELIAASRITKARTLAESSAPYADVLTDTVAQVALNTSIKHAITATRKELGKTESNRIAVLCVTSDRGMAGAYSSTIIRTTEALCEELEREGKTPVLYACGRRGYSYYQFRGRDLAAFWEGNSDAPTFERAREVGEELVKSFLSPNTDEAVDEVLIVCTEFVNMVTQKPKIVRMLPLSIVDGEIDAENLREGTYSSAGSTTAQMHLTGSTESNVASSGAKAADTAKPLYHFEPSETEVLDSILPRYVYSRIYAALLESAASETASRQRAMHTATDNASSLVDELVRKSNQARQAGITQELTEIVASADALK